jgi:hypothetical protein
MPRPPIIQYAILCDSVAQTPFYSLINLTDEIHVALEPGTARPKRETPILVPTKLVIGLYHGAPGPHTASVTWIAPTPFVVEPVAEERFTWPEGDVRHRLEANLKLPVFQQGEHRLEIRIDGDLMLQPPIMVRIRRREKDDPERHIPVALQYAVFCRERPRVKNELSIIGVVNTLTVTQPVPEGQERPPRRCPLKLVMGFIGEGGQRTIQLQPILPSGMPMESIERSFPWDTSTVFHDHVFDLNMDIPEDGLYTFLIRVDGNPAGQASVQLHYRVEETR